MGVRAAHSARRVPIGIDPGSNENRDHVHATLAKRRVVLLGESHDQAEHHRWQLHTITALFSHRPNMVLGFEMFPRRVQPVLDRWSKGEHSESDFLREVDWAQIWGFAAELYLPLFNFSRIYRLPMLALIAALGVDDVATALPWPADTDYPIHDPPIAMFFLV
jgi:uncharacterized iron-regulated protein